MNKEIINNIKKLINIQNIHYDKYYEYDEKNNLFIGYNNTNNFERINIFRNEMIIDENLYNTNYKKICKLDYIENKYYVYNNKIYNVIINNDKNYKVFYHLKLKPNQNIYDQNSFELKLLELSISKQKPSLLLHSCCGPCSSYVLAYLSKYFNITILYYNPNIDTEKEYQKRLDTQKEIVNNLGLKINIIAPNYDHSAYLLTVRGYENNREGEMRCYKCYEQRLTFLANMANNNYDYFTTTLSISPYKNANWLNDIGKRLSQEVNSNYLYSNFKLHEGYKKSIELSKKYNLYRQDYCGCEFSLRNLKKH